MKEINLDKVSSKLEDMASRGHKEVGILRDVEYGLEIADISSCYNNAIEVDKIGTLNLGIYNTKKDIQDELTILLKNYLKD
jgi:hypothetical protein